METTRRTFIVGLGAAIVTAPNVTTRVIDDNRPLPQIYIRYPHPDYPFLTAAALRCYINDLYDQVSKLDLGNPPWLSDREREDLAIMIGRALWAYKPPGLWIEVRTPLERMVRGEFDILQHWPLPGAVTIT